MLRRSLKLQKLVQPFIGDNNDMYWDIGQNKRVTLNEFKDNIYVHIRQYTEIEGKDYLIPTKKGIAMNKEQFEELKSIMHSVDTALKEKLNK